MSRLVKAVQNPKKAYRFLKDNIHPIHPAENLFLFGTSRFPIGTHVLDREWDILVILDTARVDALQILSDEYEFLTDVERMVSRGGTSPEWIAHTFDSEYKNELKQTAYITANPHAKTVLEDRQQLPSHSAAARRFYRYGSWDPVEISSLALYDPVVSYHSDLEILDVDFVGDVTPPQYITDRAIAVGREQSPKRMILHYMQPHYPWVSRAIEQDRDIEEWEERPERSKTYGRNKVFNAYLDDLRFVLDEIQVLLDNVDAETVAISSDHGDAFGEWGIYGHGPGRFHPQVRYVPWAITSASDNNEYDPQIDPPRETNSSMVSQLEALGYR
jgi:hypothetical protein